MRKQTRYHRLSYVITRSSRGPQIGFLRSSWRALVLVLIAVEPVPLTRFSMSMRVCPYRGREGTLDRGIYRVEVSHGFDQKFVRQLSFLISLYKSIDDVIL